MQPPLDTSSNDSLLGALGPEYLGRDALAESDKLDEFDENWSRELMERATDTAAENGCDLLRSGDGRGTGADNYGGFQIINRESRELVAGLVFELTPAGVLAHFEERVPEVGL